MSRVGGPWEAKMVCGNGVVKEVQGQKVVVLVQRGASCGGCAARGICGEEGELEVMALAEEALALGERVSLELADGLGLRLTFWTFGAPSLAMVAGAGGGAFLASALQWGGDGLAAIGGLTLGLLTMALTIWKHRRRPHILIRARKGLFLG